MNTGLERALPLDRKVDTSQCLFAYRLLVQPLAGFQRLANEVQRSFDLKKHIGDLRFGDGEFGLTIVFSGNST